MVTVDDSVTPLTFTLHRGDVVALLDDGSLRRWKSQESMDNRWKEISSIKNTSGSENLRVRFNGGFNGPYRGSTQLAYNDAIAACQERIYYGAGRTLQELVCPFKHN